MGDILFEVLSIKVTSQTKQRILEEVFKCMLL